MSLETFTDRGALEQIRRDLWRGREHGRASVMVGAGFSRNARRVAEGARSFPTWLELGEVLRREVDPGTPARTGGLSASDVMRLATEYEVQFGSGRLAELLRREIPNDDYEPDLLHRLLLSLPWGDIFTTNYDTLLERARRLVRERNYELVLVPADIPGRLQPRIVKLHGSFPSHRPFIITQEEYRTYPRRFAPFVNLVQEAIMETTLCLIGFSGDDPNFLAWSGWVRDELGTDAPPIYLCGLLNLTAAQRMVLDRRNIRVIDLASLFTGLGIAPDRLYGLSLEWFLRSLLAGEPPNPLRWPYGGRRPAEPPNPELPPLLPEPSPLYEIGPLVPNAPDFEN